MHFIQHFQEAKRMAMAAGFAECTLMGARPSSVGPIPPKLLHFTGHAAIDGAGVGLRPGSSTPALTDEESELTPHTPHSTPRVTPFLRSGAVTPFQRSGATTPTAVEIIPGDWKLVCVQPITPDQGDASGKSDTARTTAAYFVYDSRSGLLGAGSFAYVYKAYAVDPETGELCSLEPTHALKRLVCATTQTQFETNLKREALEAELTSRALGQAYCLAVPGRVEHGIDGAIVMPLLHGHSLSDYPRDFLTQLPLVERFRLINTLLDDLCHMGYQRRRSPAVAHRDLKPDNVILHGRSLTPVDWGMGACHSDGVSTAEHERGMGSLGYMSLDALLDDISSARDVFALAALIAYLLDEPDPTVLRARLVPEDVLPDELSVELVQQLLTTPFSFEGVLSATDPEEYEWVAGHINARQLKKRLEEQGHGHFHSFTVDKDVLKTLLLTFLRLMNNNDPQDRPSLIDCLTFFNAMEHLLREQQRPAMEVLMVSSAAAMEQDARAAGVIAGRDVYVKSPAGPDREMILQYLSRMVCLISRLSEDLPSSLMSSSDLSDTDDDASRAQDNDISISEDVTFNDGIDLGKCAMATRGSESDSDSGDVMLRRAQFASSKARGLKHREDVMRDIRQEVGIVLIPDSASRENANPPRGLIGRTGHGLLDNRRQSSGAFSPVVGDDTAAEAGKVKAKGAAVEARAAAGASCR